MSIARIWEKIDRVITTRTVLKVTLSARVPEPYGRKTQVSLTNAIYWLWRQFTDVTALLSGTPNHQTNAICYQALRLFFNNSSPPLRSILKISTQPAKNLTKERMFRSPVNVIIMPLLCYAPAGLTNTLYLCLHITRSCLSKIHMSTEWVTSNTIFGRGYVIEKPCSNILLWSQMLSKLIPSIGNNRNND